MEEADAMRTNIALLYGSWVTPPGFQRAVELWTEYYESTEMFDRRMCVARSPRTGHAIPTTGEEYRACANNAREAMKRLQRYRETEAGDVTDETWRHAQRLALERHERRR